MDLVGSTKEAVGPAYLDVDELKTGVEEAEANLAAMPNTGNAGKTRYGKAQADLAILRDVLAKAEAELVEKVAAYKQRRDEVALLCNVPLADVAEEFAAAAQAEEAAAPGVRARVAGQFEKLLNTGPPPLGKVLQVLDPERGTFTRGKVVKYDADAETCDVVLEREFYELGEPYTKDFDVTATVAREHVYAPSTDLPPLRQPLFEPGSAEANEFEAAAAAAQAQDNDDDDDANDANDGAENTAGAAQNNVGARARARANDQAAAQTPGGKAVATMAKVVFRANRAQDELHGALVAMLDMGLAIPAVAALLGDGGRSGGHGIEVRVGPQKDPARGWDKIIQKYKSDPRKLGDFVRVAPRPLLRNGGKIDPVYLVRHYAGAA